MAQVGLALEQPRRPWTKLGNSESGDVGADAVPATASDGDSARTPDAAADLTADASRLHENPPVSTDVESVPDVASDVASDAAPATPTKSDVTTDEEAARKAASPQTVDVASRALYHATRRTFESHDGRGWREALDTPEEAASLTTKKLNIHLKRVRECAEKEGPEVWLATRKILQPVVDKHNAELAAAAARCREEHEAFVQKRARTDVARAAVFGDADLVELVLSHCGPSAVSSFLSVNRFVSRLTRTRPMILLNAVAYTGAVTKTIFSAVFAITDGSLLASLPHTKPPRKQYSLYGVAAAKQVLDVHGGAAGVAQRRAAWVRQQARFKYQSLASSAGNFGYGSYDSGHGRGGYGGGSYGYGAPAIYGFRRGVKRTLRDIASSEDHFAKQRRTNGVTSA